MGLYSRIHGLTGFLLLAIAATSGAPIPSPGVGIAQQDSDLIRQAKAMEDQQNYPAAEDIYRRVLASDPDNPEALKHLGILEQTDLKFDESIQHFKRILAEQPDYPQVNFFLGLSYFGLHDNQDAVASFQNELKTAKPHPATGYYLALSLEAAGKLDEAIDAMNEVAAKNPNRSDVFFTLARMHMTASFKAFGQLRKIDPDSFQIHAFMGSLFYQEAHYEAAVSQFQTALKKQPDAQGIHSSLGIAYFMLHQLDPAEKELLLALKEAPDDPLANFYLGDLELHQHQLTTALPYLKAAAALQPKDAESRLLLVRCYLEMGDLQNAKEVAVQTANLAPADPRSHYMLAEIYQKLNQPADRQRELDMFNKLSAEQKAKGTDDANKAPGSPQDNSQ